MKKITSLLLVMLLLIGTITPVMSNDNIAVKIDGQQIVFDVQPQLINGRTMVPLRAIFEALGATVYWDDYTQTVTSSKNGITISLTINNPAMYVNSTTVTLDSPACLIDGRTLVPVRAISEAFGTNVDWDGESSTVVITTANVNETVTMYAVDGKTIVVTKADVEDYKKVGWYLVPVVTMYAIDGRNIVVAQSEAESYKNVGWYYTLAETQQTLYAPDGRSITVYKSEVPAYTTVGWYETEAMAIAANKPANDTSSINPTADGYYYRTPKGKRYHLDPNCGGKNSYKTTNISGLSPCSKCAR